MSYNFVALLIVKNENLDLFNFTALINELIECNNNASTVCNYVRVY